ncbi:hypothetical protein [Candidatus Deianiraea vastatrix]|uniref:Uncharacterized protein n=1 Tax=Candidatus Deianiraea vastatrix TaxID=2163644 RepID=A0A5B8XC82_9RICK|nr:hypothetical protein [Candidatus Deianiraea vastatrix]QED22953.1 hypothetical protein Deia_00142 [Candidatus Deianiraea vastatrix]
MEQPKPTLDLTEEKDRNDLMQNIINRFYKAGEGEVNNSELHGARHIAHTNFIARKVFELYKKHDKAIFGNVDNIQLEKILIALAFHDSSRVNEGFDNDEVSSAILFLYFAITKNLMTAKEAIQLAFAIAMKDDEKTCNNSQFRELHNFLSDNSGNNIENIKKYIPNEKHTKIQKCIGYDFKWLQSARSEYNKNNGIEFNNFYKAARIIIHEADCLDIGRLFGKNGFRNNCTEYYKKFGPLGDGQVKNMNAFNEFEALKNVFVPVTHAEQQKNPPDDYFKSNYNNIEKEFNAKQQLYQVQYQKQDKPQTQNPDQLKQQQELEEQKRQEELKLQKKQQEELEEKKRQEELELQKKQQEELEKLKQQEELEQQNQLHIYKNVKGDIYKINTDIYSRIRIKQNKNRMQTTFTHDLIINQMSEILTLAINNTKAKYPQQCGTLLDNIYFITFVINFAIAKKKVGNSSVNEWKDYYKEEFPNNNALNANLENEFKVAKELSYQYQKIAQQQYGFLTGRCKHLRKTGLVGQRLSRIPEKHVSAIAHAAISASPQAPQT